jgi:GNAT superfamily N-acetyltransferase
MFHDQPPWGLTVPITLKDGSVALLKPVTSNEQSLIREGLRHMSPESRRLRFGVGVDHLSDSEIRYLTDLDHINHVAWGAMVDGEPAGLSRYIRLNNSDVAEIAVTVVDKFQSRGLARVLVGALVASARMNGIKKLAFAIDPGNRGVLNILRDVETVLDETAGMIQGAFDVGSLAPETSDHALDELLKRYQD